MFLRKLYLNLIKILNHKYTFKYLKLVSFEKLSIAKSDVRDMDIFKKIYLCVLPNVFSNTYYLLNDNTIHLINFRKKFLPNFSHRFETYISYDYDFICKEFFSTYLDFIKENISEDFTVLNKTFKSNDEVFSLYLMLFFLKKHFYHFFSLNFFNNFSDSNLIKIHFIFSKFFFKKNFDKLKKLYFKDIEKYNNFFTHVDFLSNSNFVIQESVNNFEFTKPSRELKIFQKNVDDKIDDDLRPYVRLYSDACWALYDKTTYRLIKTIFRVKINLNSLWDVFIESDFLKKVKTVFPYRYSDSSVNKFIDLSRIDDFVLFFLRKNKIFNKGRYSRNRQTYRTGFYWCLWLNIFVVYGLHFVFYRFIFTFGYLWLFLFIFFASFIFSRALKYNLINYNSVIREIGEFFNFLKFIFLNLFVFFKKLLIILKNIFMKLIKPSEPYQKIDLDESDFNINFSFFTENQFLIDLYNSIEDYIYEVFESDIELLFRTDSEFSENIKSVRDCSVELIFLTDAHDIGSEMVEERMLEYQRDLIEKLRGN